MNNAKLSLRNSLREMRRQLSSERVANLSRAIVSHVVSAPFYQRARTIGLYHPIDNEVDPTPLLLDVACSEKKFFLPLADKTTGSLCFVPYVPGDPLRLGVFGILEPIPVAHQAVVTDTFQLDLILLPLVGFDRSGCRLGFGGGYYDRMLSDTRHFPGRSMSRVGLAYGFQELPVVPREPHDVLLDGVVTEQGVCELNEKKDLGGR